ncbi:MAG: response regulator [Campylobacterales bacterium]
MKGFSEIIPTTQTITLLYVEDEPVNQEYFASIFRDIFSEVRCASDGKEGLEIFKEYRPDMVISDLRMPKKDGLEMLKEIKEIDQDVETIITTAHSDADFLLKAIELGIDRYLIKPIHSAKLKKALELSVQSIARKRALIEKAELSEELEELTTHLEKRVKEETKKRISQEQILIQQSKMAQMGEIIGVIAHQWKQPLSVISLIFQMLKDDLSSEQKNSEILKEYIDDGMQQVIFLLNTMDDFRNFMKPSMQKTDFNITKTVESVNEIISALMLKSNIEVEIKSEDEVLLVYGYENELKQVFLNLLSNAKDAVVDLRDKDGIRKSEFKGKVNINISKEDNYAKIVFQDNGKGIDEAMLPVLFDQYTSTKGENGTGIGLYMSKTIIEQNMNGQIWAENSPHGASFICKIPLSVQS